MTKQYRVNAFVRINNATVSSLVRLGIKVEGFSLLTVRGRKRRGGLPAFGEQCELLRHPPASSFTQGKHGHEARHREWMQDATLLPLQCAPETHRV